MSFDLLPACAAASPRRERIAEQLASCADSFLGAVVRDGRDRPASTRRRASGRRCLARACQRAAHDCDPEEPPRRVHIGPAACRPAGPALLTSRNPHMYTAKGRLDDNAMLKQYSPLVRRLAHQMIAKLPANVEIDDLIQVGMIGLTRCARPLRRRRRACSSRPSRPSASAARCSTSCAAATG